MTDDFFKYHALGNDYIVMDPNRSACDLRPGAIRLICDRNRGIGSDGVLLGPVLEGGNIRLRIFNPDGSEAEKSGNGIRIFSRYLLEAGYVKQPSFDLSTLGGLVRVEVLEETGGTIRVDMGRANFLSSEIPVSGPVREVLNETLEIGNETLRVTCLSVGNPHCVIPMDIISKEMAMRLGPAVERHALFPKRINVQFMRVMDRGSLELQIWERGAGYTLASGSSSCAAAAAAHKLGLADSSIKVHMPGGVIEIEIRPEGNILMTGPVASIASGAFSPEFRAALDKADREHL